MSDLDTMTAAELETERARLADAGLVWGRSELDRFDAVSRAISRLDALAAPVVAAMECSDGHHFRCNKFELVDESAQCLNCGISLAVLKQGDTYFGGEVERRRGSFGR